MGAYGKGLWVWRVGVGSEGRVKEKENDAKAKKRFHGCSGGDDARSLRIGKREWSMWFSRLVIGMEENRHGIEIVRVRLDSKVLV